MVDSGSLWASLVLDFDPDHRVTSITTADPSLVDLSGTPAELAGRLASWVESRGRRVSLCVVCDLDGAQELLVEGTGKLEALAALATGDRAAISRGTSID